MAASHSTSQDYNPPRFKWTKRIAWGSLGLGVLNVALWGSATLIAQHRLDKMIASYRAVGEPVYAEDFNVSKNIPDDENAATYYMKAVSVYRWPGIIDPSVNLERLFDAVRFGHGDEFAAEIDALISTNGEAIELVRRGAQCEDVDWGIDVSWPLFDCVLPSFGPRRDLVWLLGVAVEKSQTEGQHRRLIELLFAQVRLSDQVGQNPPVMIAHMLGNLCSTRACVTIEFVTPNLAVAGDDPVAVTGASQARRFERSSIKLPGRAGRIHNRGRLRY
ncbi:MAG: hypothetical protein R3E58_03535 [Phycisphaerae bacterium]